MNIPQPVINTFNRVGFNYADLDKESKDVTVQNPFSGQTCETTELVARLINWVYNTNLALEQGYSNVKISDFDRVRYFIAKVDPDAYMTCID